MDSPLFSSFGLDTKYWQARPQLSWPATSITEVDLHMVSKTLDWIHQTRGHNLNNGRGVLQKRGGGVTKFHISNLNPIKKPSPATNPTQKVHNPVSTRIAKSLCGKIKSWSTVSARLSANLCFGWTHVHTHRQDLFHYPNSWPLW